MAYREPELVLFLDKERIREVVSESLRVIEEFVYVEVDKDAVFTQLDKVLSNGRVSTKFFLQIANNVLPDLKLRIDPIRRRVLCVSSEKRSLIVSINHVLKVL